NFNAITVDSGAQWTLTNTASIASGVTLTDLGTLTALGTVINAGAILAASGTFIIDPATLVNSGYISGTVTLSGGGAVTNPSAGAGIYIQAGVASVNNSGLISGNLGGDVGLRGGGLVVNSGIIATTTSGNAVAIGTSSGGAGTVVNSGTISAAGTNSGVRLK